jgi:hypothetical protein
LNWEGSLVVNWGGFLPCFAHILGLNEIIRNNLNILRSNGIQK